MMIVRNLLIVMMLTTALVSGLQCRDGFFIRSDAFDVDRSSPAPVTCPSTAESGCVRFEVEGEFSTSGQQIGFTFWMTSCGSSENCTAECTDDLNDQMLRVLRRVGSDDGITVDATCETACCSGDDCNSVPVPEIKESGQLVATNDDTDGNSLAGAETIITDLIIDIGGSASTPSCFNSFQTLVLLAVTFLCFM